MQQQLDLTSAMRRADPRLSKYNPLPRILFFDDFDEGINGWCELCGNHDNNLDNIRPLVGDLRPPQLSNWRLSTAVTADAR